MGEVRTQKPSSDSASGVETKWFTVLWVPETAPRQGPSLGLPVVFTASRVVSIPQGSGLSRSRRELGPAQGKPRVTLRPRFGSVLGVEIK